MTLDEILKQCQTVCRKLESDYPDYPPATMLQAICWMELLEIRNALNRLEATQQAIAIASQEAQQLEAKDVN